MKRLPSYFLCVIACMTLFSCKDSAFKGFDKMDNGAYMQFHYVNKQGDMPQLGDLVYVDLKQSVGDSLIYSSEWDNEDLEIEMTESSFIGDMMAGLYNMHINDSATIAYLVDSLCIKTLGMDAVPDFLVAGMPIYVDIRLNSIIRAEEVAEMRRQELLQMKQDDEDRLAIYYSDVKNKLTETGLIILDVKGKGRGAKDGEIIMMNFNMITLEGDTLLDMFDREPVAV